MIRAKPHYRHDAFIEGLAACGFDPVRSDSPDHDLGPGDLLVTWNLYGRYLQAHERARARGAATIVAENGYLGTDAAGRQLYALGLGGHNGYGRTFPRGPERWRALGLRPAPWADRPDGYVLVADQRGIGHPDWRSPRDFLERARAALRDAGESPVRVRYHPGRHEHQRPLEADLDGARLVVVWSSNVANHALLRGVPAIRLGPYHVNPSVPRWEPGSPLPGRSSRTRGFEELAWAQWTVDEITAGAPFRHLLEGATGCTSGV